ncbi:hypothetical protein DICVIV_14417 [Dictyocaulus viviparus]|uniref:Uncharacterized protein n=1 Tax=Dictyocaulus viviparus TaxID=29172 RepID=A0A0D8X5E8_DICVI|nr:hypothetical protein DICVIV_14417 [Dictyocaulus viviparus]
MTTIREKLRIPRLRTQEKEDLPRRRIDRSLIFINVGLDYFGPVIVGENDEREGNASESQLRAQRPG